MAFFQIDFFSKALARTTSFNIILQNDFPLEMAEGNECYKRETKTLYLLHGYSGSRMDWVLGSYVQDMAAKYNLAIVMPSGDNSFYLDGKGTGRAYCKYVGKELVEYVSNTFGLSGKKEDIYIGGYSMGGFGAIHTGLTYPETFGKIFALSSALIIHNIENIKEDFRDGVADYDYYSSIFGDLSALDKSENNPEYLICKMKENQQNIPFIYMACGTEDFLIQENRAFHKFLLEETVDVQYVESPGAHNWTFWNQNLEPAIQWLLS